MTLIGMMFLLMVVKSDEDVDGYGDEDVDEDVDGYGDEDVDLSDLKYYFETSFIIIYIISYIIVYIIFYIVSIMTISINI